MSHRRWLAMEIGASGWIGNWSPGIGDPSIVGWFTVFAYFVTAWLCFQARRRCLQQRGVPRLIVIRESLLWLSLATILVALGINKQLDLQSAMTELFRQLALRQGWYDHRRFYQIFFIRALVLMGAVSACAMLFIMRRLSSGIQLAGVGLCFLGCFVLIRAMSFHNMDELIHRQISIFRVNWLLEIGGIGVIALGSHWQRLRTPSASKGRDAGS